MTDFYFLIFLIIYFAVVFWGIIVGSSKGYSPVVFGFLGVFLGLIGVAIAYMLPNKNEKIKRPIVVTYKKTKTCPECAETVLAAARKCKWCGSLI